MVLAQLIDNAIQNRPESDRLEHGVATSPLKPATRCEKLAKPKCIPLWNVTRFLAGVAVDTCLTHRADPGPHIHPKRGPRPLGDRRFRFSGFLEENAMNLSALSRADLVRELLSPLVCASSINPLHVSDAVAQMGMLGTTDTVLAHRLGIARELLLRDLRERLCKEL